MVRMALEEELAKTLQGIHDLSLRVETSERWVFVGLPSFLSPSKASLFLPAVLTIESVCLSCQGLGFAYDTTRKRSPYERCVRAICARNPSDGLLCQSSSAWNSRYECKNFFESWTMEATGVSVTFGTVVQTLTGGTWFWKLGYMPWYEWRDHQKSCSGALTRRS